MQQWSFIEQGEDGITPVVVTMTEADILRAYYAWWSGEMTRVGKADHISEQACIDDWVVVHWAQRVP